jgi:hypothetical protein
MNFKSADEYSKIHLSTPVNQLYYDQHGCCTGEEYEHHFKGIKHFYRESLILNNDSSIAILKYLLTKKTPGRNTICPCCSNKKFKLCDIESVKFLTFLGRERLEKDLEGFLNDNNFYLL